MPQASDIIDEKKINAILKETQAVPQERILSIIEKAKKMKGLELEEVGALLQAQDESLWEKIFEAASFVKNSIYGERLVFFAPLYISSFCVNDCEYCGFHARNKACRKKLTMEEVSEQVKALVDMGHKRLLLEFGEDLVNNPIDYVVDTIKTIYATKSGKGEIRRVNVNIAATSIEDYRKLKEVGIGTYQLFQETYHRDTYAKMHRGPKADYERQIFAHVRAFEAGLDDFGLGVLFGLYDHRFETLALVAHAQYLEKTLGVGPHTLSVPRFQPADTVKMESPFKVTEEDLLKVIAVLRLAVPYTGMIISTRERPEIRARAFEIGISQTSAASRTSPGGYGKKEALAQFVTADHRTLDEVVSGILEMGLMPSFCTACYRQGRTGEDFMKIAKPGEIHYLCRPNAILTFKEYLEDYASPEVCKKGEAVIRTFLDQIEDTDRRKETLVRLERIENGERDLYF